MNEILIFLLSLAGAFVLRVCGFGFGVFTMAWLPYLLPSYGEATTLSGILAMAGSILVAFKNWRKIDWHKLTPILITFIVSSCASIHFVSVADDHLLKRILGVMLIIASLWFLAISKHVKVKPTLPVQITMGTISGVMGGLFAMHGPAAVLYFLACAKDKDEYVVLTMTYLLLGNIMMLGLHPQRLSHASRGPRLPLWHLCRGHWHMGGEQGVPPPLDRCREENLLCLYRHQWCPLTRDVLSTEKVAITQLIKKTASSNC